MGKFMNITTMESHLDRIVQWLLWPWEWKVSLNVAFARERRGDVGTLERHRVWSFLASKKTQTFTGSICKSYEYTHAGHIKHIIISNSIHHSWGMIVCSCSKEYQQWDCHNFYTFLTQQSWQTLGNTRITSILQGERAQQRKTGEVLLFWKEVHRRDVAGSSHTQKFPVRLSTIVDLKNLLLYQATRPYTWYISRRTRGLAIWSEFDWLQAAKSYSYVQSLSAGWLAGWGW